ncbi:hypothetical protein LCGC14_1724890 [marine sediment metagenome]|uniref:Nucleic acid-binding protein n=1 Tax=marine sediment metagenome TaxID=412755 RepID=A0A0F9HZ63_9ZZZZ
MTRRGFERTSKRRKGFPSETRVKRGRQVVHGEKELIEKLGRNDLCPCGSGRRFQEMLYEDRTIRRRSARPLLLENSLRAAVIPDRPCRWMEIQRHESRRSIMKRTANT